MIDGGLFDSVKAYKDSKVRGHAHLQPVFWMPQTREGDLVPCLRSLSSVRYITSISLALTSALDVHGVVQQLTRTFSDGLFFFLESSWVFCEQHLPVP